MSYLVEACEKMAKQHPEILVNTAVVVLGGHAEELCNSFRLPMYPLGYVVDTQKIVDVYNAVDVFVTPSYQTIANTYGSNGMWRSLRWF